MIPKIIHYCWFGGKEMPKQFKKYIKSWKKYCPNYELKLWNESNFDVNCNQYVKEAYENKKFAFVTDYVRLYVLYNFGGIYMDTDVEVRKPLDEFLDNEAFSGFESSIYVPTGIMGSEKGNTLFKILLDYYNDRHFVKDDGTLDTTTNVKIITSILNERNLKLNNMYQKLEGITLYPSDYFCPINARTREKNITKNTYTIHWFAGSWIPTKIKIKNKIIFVLTKVFGAERLSKIINTLKGKRKYD